MSLRETLSHYWCAFEGDLFLRLESELGGRLPREATFSRAFSEFAESRLASRFH